MKWNYLCTIGQINLTLNYYIIMIRDNRRINIETNFFDDDEYFVSKPHEDTFQTNLQNRYKGAIAIYNTLDTIRLHRIINAFNILNSIDKIRIRKYSSREILVPNRSLKKIAENFTSQKISKSKLNEQETNEQNVIKRVGSIFHNKKRTESLKTQVRSQSQYLRQSRKRILESINRTLGDKSHEKSMDKSLNNQEAKKVIKKQVKVVMENNETKAPQNNNIKNRIHKLEKLMKNIRREKERNEPVVVHQKTQVTKLPKQETSKSQMHVIMEQFQSIRNQVHQIKKINEQILHHSRERSLKSSRTGARSQNHAIPEAMKALNFKNIKKSEVLDYSEKASSKPNSINSQKKNNSNIPQSQPRQHRLQERNNRELNGVDRQASTNVKPSRAPVKQKIANRNINEQEKVQKKVIKNNEIAVNNVVENKPIHLHNYDIGNRGRIQGKQMDKGFKPKSARQQAISHHLQVSESDGPVSNATPTNYQKEQQIDNMRSIGHRPNQEYVSKPIEHKIYDTKRQQGYQNQKSNNFNIYQFIQDFESNKKAAIKPQSSEQRRLENEYKESAWYKQYGSPSYNMKINVKPGFNRQDFDSYNIGTSQQQNLVQLNQIKDTVSNSNVNSNYNSRTSSPNSGSLGYEGTNYQSYNGNKKYTTYMDSNAGYKDNNFLTQNVQRNNYKVGEMGYTNPDLLKQLNIGPFPKRDSSLSPEKSFNYDLDSKYGFNNISKISSGYESKPRKDYTTDYGSNQKWNSFKTLSDGNQIGSYTYSKGSSAVTSMAKLEQQYESVINGDGLNTQIKSYPTNDATYQPFRTLYSGDNYESGQANMSKISTLEEDINKYFSNNMKFQPYEYIPTQWDNSDGYNKHNSPVEPQRNYQQFYDKYAKDS